MKIFWYIVCVFFAFIFFCDHNNKNKIKEIKTLYVWEHCTPQWIIITLCFVEMKPKKKKKIQTKLKYFLSFQVHNLENLLKIIWSTWTMFAYHVSYMMYTKTKKNCEPAIKWSQVRDYKNLQTTLQNFFKKHVGTRQQ